MKFEMLKNCAIQYNEALAGEWKLNLLELFGPKSSRTISLQIFRICKVAKKNSFYREEHEIP